MSREQLWIVVAGAVALGLLLCVLLALVGLSRLRREVRDLRGRLDRVEERPAVREAAPARAQEDHEATPYVITHLGSEQVDPHGVGVPAEEVQPGRIEGRLFADLVARETVVKAAGLAHGVRRVLDPEVRHRIRFEMRRELKRARRQRKADLKAALRDLQAREAADRGDAA